MDSKKEKITNKKKKKKEMDVPKNINIKLVANPIPI